MKRMAFHKTVLAEVLSVIIYGLSAICLAQLGFGIWSLVWGNIIYAAAMALMLWRFSAWKPSFYFDSRLAAELFRYGGYVGFAALLSLLLLQGDNFFVGRMLGAGWLGFYVMAFNMTCLVNLNVSQVVSQVMLPVYSKMQEAGKELSGPFAETLSVINFMILPLTLGIFLLAPGLVSVILGDRWLPMVPAMRLLCFFGLFSSLSAAAQTLFLALGKSRIVTQIQQAQLMVLGILIYPMTGAWGIAGTATAVSLASAVRTGLMLKKLSRLDLLNIKKLLMSHRGALISLCFMAAAVLLMKQIFPAAAFKNLLLTVCPKRTAPWCWLRKSGTGGTSTGGISSTW